jgi:surface antigen
MVVIAALGVAGCSIPLDMFDRTDADLTTGSISGATGRGVQPAVAAGAAAPSEYDLAYARAAAADLLARGAKDSSVPWENPHTGAGGNVTALAASHQVAELTCRQFLVTYMRQGGQSWLEGEACRGLHGKWEVRSLKPYERS